MYKYLVLLSLLVLLTNAISLSSSHQVDSVLLSHDQKAIAGHHLQVHDGADVASAIASGIYTGISLAKYIADYFPVTCSQSGYKRQNAILVLNRLDETISYAGTYQDSGKIFDFGDPYDLPTNQVAKWVFVKHAGTSTGSNGVLMYNLPDAVLTIFYENPWSGWNFAGACLDQLGQQEYEEEQMQSVYDELYGAFPNWPKNCVLGDNKTKGRNSRSYNFKRSLQLKSNGYVVSIYMTYRFKDNEGADDCLNQVLNVVISKK